MNSSIEKTHLGVSVKFECPAGSAIPAPYIEEALLRLCIDASEAGFQGEHPSSISLVNGDNGYEYLMTHINGNIWGCPLLKPWHAHP